MGKYQKNIEAARRITVVQYLEIDHPGELVRTTDREYCTRTHDSLIITPANGFFHWFSRHVGGNNAIDYLTKVEGMDFVSAVRLLNEMAPVTVSFQPAKAAPVKPHEPRPFTLPTPDRNAEAVVAYLMHRGISPKVLRYCVGSGILYQTTRSNCRNCVFVGKDEHGVARCAFQRGCQGTFRGDVSGSQKQYGFLISAEDPECDTVEIYEAQARHAQNNPAADAASASGQVRREAFRRGRFRALAIEKSKPTPSQATVSSAAMPMQTPQVSARQKLRRQVLIQYAVRRYFQKETGNKAASTAVSSRLPLFQYAGAASKRAATTQIGRLFQLLMAAVKRLLAQTVQRAVAALLALLASGGAVLVLVTVIGAAAAVIGSPMGILFADESGDPNSIRIAEIVAETNADFGEAINEIVAAHPECSETTIEYDYEDGHTWASYWPEVLAVFAVHTNLNSDSDVVVIDEGKKLLIQNTFWSMHQIDSEIETVTTTPEPTEDEPDPEPVTEHILHITVSSKSVAELAEEYNFTQDQRDILDELLSDELRPYLLALCGGVGDTVGDGTLQWPLPGHTYISCHFGEVDAFGNAGHRGTDIPAPEGTPILAAHSGTVLVSGWNDSYGNQVLLDNGAGLSTRYAHMAATAVTAGETVTAGQVIGYVGSTGDSTGNHLHFEMMQGGIRVNPLDMVSPN